MPTIKTLLNALDARFPFSHAESWDKTGLQIGDANSSVDSVFVAYEITDAVLDAAQSFDCLVVYHPLLFRPLENLDFKNHTARLAARILTKNQSLIAVHTALDGAAPPNALGDALAASLGLQNVEVLSPSGSEKLVKIGAMVPPDSLQKIADAMWNAGAGKIGFYDQASFQTEGKGTFRPLDGARPFEGEIGARSEVAEVRLEVIAPESGWKNVVAALQEAHPYEEVAFDVTLLLNSTKNEEFGPARIGEIPACGLKDFAARVQSALSPPNLRVVSTKNEEIRKVVCTPGAGASFIGAAARAGADVLVCGDIKHHDALQARALGLSLVDVTHAATERATIPLMAGVLETVAGLEVRRGEMQNPFEAI
ncbi:dinuclear metal center protein, YbgI/SA1388 family [Abditibacterium utsteinense]|uniref:GTP cyclohydrolase 1 type 2 homolog n=1 Tax=Abditibacterium utsteinense TaxID=1960156 RepID=A0A2S8SR86_9BACT|nr:Nif3-like dinuclear metal center hexameric protein [Abditibacterium utsteinense]PQV63259.1 dinuclear metal center protein, YbgI/SA1388 family [Abditibacterium utsteinense]